MFVGLRERMIFNAGYTTIAEGAHDCGVDVLELRYEPNRCVFSPHEPLQTGENMPAAAPEDWEKVRRAYEAEGLRITGVLLRTDFNAEDKQAQVQFVVDALRFAEAVGASSLRIDAAMTGQRELPWLQRVNIYADAVLRIIEATEDCDIPMGIENHGAQGNDPAWLGGVIARVNHPRLGWCIDTGNLYWAGHPLSRVYQIIRTFAPHVVHAHAKNICYPGYLRERQREMGYKYAEYACAIPDGDVDHAVVVSILRDAGYTGGLYIEDEGIGRAGGPEARKAQLKRDIEYLRELVE